MSKLLVRKMLTSPPEILQQQTYIHMLFNLLQNLFSSFYIFFTPGMPRCEPFLWVHRQCTGYNLLHASELTHKAQIMSTLVLLPYQWVQIVVMTGCQAKSGNLIIFPLFIYVNIALK